MTTSAWIIIGIIAIPIIWFFFSTIIGFTVSKTDTGRAYLRQSLKKNGVDINTIPAECINHIVELCIVTAEMRKNSDPGCSHKGLNEIFVDVLDYNAEMIILWLKNPNDERLSDTESSDGPTIKNPFRKIFEKYNLGK